MEKFKNPLKTAKGEERAFVDLETLKTLWFNTGTICNLSCQNCYIESSPRNDRLAFINEKEVLSYLEELRELHLPVELIGLTGGEPFANPHIIAILKSVLERDFEVLVLTNAYKAIRKYQSQLKELHSLYGGMLKIRVSLDHYSKEIHEEERGEDTFEETLLNLKWLVENGFNVSVAGRALKKEPIHEELLGYQNLFESCQIPLNLEMNDNIVIFPEMDQKHDVPEISTGCWSILKKSPLDQMCATERMIVKEKESGKLFVMPCTLLAYDDQFKLGRSLKEAGKRVQLNHPFCAKFCVLGGASCSSTK